MDLSEVVKELEDQQALGRVSGVEIFRGMLNQPELLSISSANAQAIGSSYAYSGFAVDMPRPILQADRLQLLSANIPLCTQNFPDTSCAFWYYRTDEYVGTVPNPETLFCVRLLPSYYKPEFAPSGFGYNQTFNTYPDVAVQLALACKTDLAYVNMKTLQIGPTKYQLHYIPNDISLTLGGQNKFQTTGLNIAAPIFSFSSADTYNAGTTYAVGVYVSYDAVVYRSIQAGNTGHTPSASPTWWSFVTDKLVRNYAVGTAYREAQYVSSGGTIYMADVDIYASGSFNAGNGWVTPTAEYNYRYLVTGYNDPNVALLQGNGRRQWTPYSVFETSDVVQHLGQTYVASQQSKGWLPFLTSGSTVYDITRTNYAVGDVVLRSSAFWKCISKPPANSITTNPFTCAAYWIPSYWTPTSDSTNLPVVGLNTISSQFDMLDNFNSTFQYPFPFGIPGQPFNPTPRRLLNSLLGFCWNGVFNANAVDDSLRTIQSKTSITTDLLNRLRPVPRYYTRYRDAGLNAGQGTTALIYTADGYANLVYTSVVSIYSTIVYGSTLDTQRNTNLLGLAGMDATNLGVSFSTNFIDAPLRVNGADIYSIGIEMRDEMNEPYLLTNNGISTFTLKISYKDSTGKITTG